MKLLLVGDDARTKALAKLLAAHYDVYFHFAMAWGMAQNELLQRYDPDVVILPMQSPKLTVETLPSGHRRWLVGQLTAVWQKLLPQAECYADDAHFLWHNASLTAQSFIMHLWQQQARIAGARFTNAGFGRVGKMVAFYLAKLGAHVHIITNDEAQLAEASAHLYTSSSLAALPDELGVVINTILAQWVNAASSKLLQVKLYDLASAPGCLADVAHAAYERLPQLPARYLPKQAAELLKHILIEQIKEESC